MQQIIFEHPLNERVRNFLRLEFLFRQAQHFSAGDATWDSRMYLATLMDILVVLGRADLKTELIKELERNIASLGALRDNPEVDHQQLGTILKHLDYLRGGLLATNGQLGQELRDNEFLASVRQRTSIPGGTCDFDLPAYHLWLHKPPEERRDYQLRWFETLKLVRQSVELLLKLVRGSASPSREVAQGGNFQKSLDSGVPYQLIRIAIESEQPCFAEISGGKHRFSVRFMGDATDGRAQQVTFDVPFRLTCCIL